MAHDAANCFGADFGASAPTTSAWHRGIGGQQKPSFTTGREEVLLCFLQRAAATLLMMVTLRDAPIPIRECQQFLFLGVSELLCSDCSQ
jgi:hypothetical protein